MQQIEAKCNSFRWRGIEVHQGAHSRRFCLQNLEDGPDLLYAGSMVPLCLLYQQTNEGPIWLRAGIPLVPE